MAESQGPLLILPTNLSDILSEEYNLFYFKKDNSYAIYISNYQLNIDDLKKSIGYITFTIDYEDSDLTVQYIQSNMQRVGLGHYLMIIVAYIAHNQNIKKILLDDDSDLAHQGSIYQKLGCEYINPNPNPEMECSPQKILGKFNEFYVKYKGKGLIIII